MQGSSPTEAQGAAPRGPAPRCSDSPWSSLRMPQASAGRGAPHRVSPPFPAQPPLTLLLWGFLPSCPLHLLLWEAAPSLSCFNLFSPRSRPPHAPWLPAPHTLHIPLVSPSVAQMSPLPHPYCCHHPHCPPPPNQDTAMGLVPEGNSNDCKCLGLVSN